jgi:hypothetical protein
LSHIYRDQKQIQQMSHYREMQEGLIKSSTSRA